MAESSPLVRRLGFFYDHAVNLSVVGNDRHKRMFRPSIHPHDPEARPKCLSVDYRHHESQGPIRICTIE